MTPCIEIAGAALGLIYLALAIRENRLCWVAGAASSLLFLWVFWRVDLIMQSLLQIYYVGIAAHAWVHWGKPKANEGEPITRLSGREHSMALALLVALTIATLALRQSFASTAAILDALTSWGGVIATWFVARKKLDAWLYWIGIDAATVTLYLQADLLASAALYALFTALAFVGWREWQKSYHEQSAPPGSAHA